MRFAELLWRHGLLAALCVGMLGCATVTEPLMALKEAVIPASASVSPTGALAPAAAPAAAAAPVKPEPETPVSAAAQRAFDDALRLLRAGRTEEAERGFRALVKSNPELGGPHANLGLMHRQAGKLPEAVAEFELAVRASPRQPVYLNQLGITLRQHGQFAKAREAYEKAIALDPHYAPPQLNLGILHDLYLWDGKRALELYDRYLALSPGGDATVTKWIADLKNRKQASIALNGTRKEKE
jgi:Flp pilus assembly protein TadD